MNAGNALKDADAAVLAPVLAPMTRLTSLNLSGTHLLVRCLRLGPGFCSFVLIRGDVRMRGCVRPLAARTSEHGVAGRW